MAVLAADNSRFVDLPVREFHDTIVQSVDQNQVTIVTAETGAGKSTQIPQYLAEHGYTRVIVTQPRILAARNLSHRVREEWALRNSEDSSEIIGFRTAHERDDSGRTNVLYCTDGLQLVRELTGAGTNDRQVLVLDEVHEWNENMEVLVAWAKKRCEQEPNFKVVIMSATIETDDLAQFFGTTAVLNIPGRHYEVTWQHGTDILSELLQQLQKPKHNILTFLPGKAEIQAVLEAIQKPAKAAGVPVLPLHSQLDAETQQEAFGHYPNGKIILSTNIAQTSVTIDDIDMVLDSGLERRSEVRSGVEGLFIAQTSQADCLQRAGRAGRTKPGTYVLAQYDTMPCAKFDDRPDYPTPEIMRKHINRLTLRLANVGIDIELLDFYHDPSKKAIQRAKRTLHALGALRRNGEITDIGREMEQFPVESNYARMLVEVKKYDDTVRSKLATIIAIQEVGGIVKSGNKFTGWRAFTRQTKSDFLAEFDVYLAHDSIDETEREEIGIIEKNVQKAKEVVERLHRDLGLNTPVLAPIGDDEASLLKCIVAGQLDELWMMTRYGTVEHISTKQQRELSSSSVVRVPRLMTGTPFDLQIPTKSGGLETLHLVQGITAVNVEWLTELAPEMFSPRAGKPFYDPRLGTLARRQLVRFGGRVLEGMSTPILENTPKNKTLFVREFSKWAHAQLEKEQRNLSKFHSHVPSVSLRQVERRVAAEADGVISLEQLSREQKKRLVGLTQLEAFHGSFMNELGSPRRENNHKRRPIRKFERRHGKHHR